MVTDDIGVGLSRVDSVGWQTDDHADAPGIASQEPVAQGAFHLAVGIVTREAAVENALREHGRYKVVGAPYARYAEVERVVFAFAVYAVDAGAHVAEEL